MLKRRYEILLPLAHNDGRPVDENVLEQTREELVQRFGGLSAFPQSVLGIWVYDDQRYEDASMMLTIDVEDSAENRQWLSGFKQVLLERFEQLEIYIVSYPVDIL